MKMLVVCTTDSMIWNFLIPHIEYWKEKGNTVDIACSKTGFYFDELANKHGYTMFEMPFTRFPFSTANMRAFKQLKTLVVSNDYDVVVSQEPVGGVLGRLAGCKGGAKNVYAAHGFHFFKGAPLKNWLIFYPIEKFMARKTDVLVTINEEDYQAAQNFKAKKVVKIDGIGVNLERFSCTGIDRDQKRQELGIPANAKVILTVAEMIPRKNYQTALKTIASLKDKNILYLICGDGELQMDLEELCKRLGVEQQVHFLGFRKDVNEIYHCADLFLFTSFQEGLSIALIEAMTAGLPIVCSRIRGNTDLVVEGKGGWLCDPVDVDAFAACISKVLAENAPPYGKYNAEHVRQFDIGRAVEKFYQAIEMSGADRDE